MKEPPRGVGQRPTGDGTLERNKRSKERTTSK